VAAAANGDRELVVPPEIDRGGHVGDVGASSDEQRPLVDHGVVELSRFLVFRMVAPDNRTAKTLGEIGNNFVVHGVPPYRRSADDGLVHRLGASANFPELAHAFRSLARSSRLLVTRDVGPAVGSVLVQELYRI